MRKLAAALVLVTVLASGCTTPQELTEDKREGPKPVVVDFSSVEITGDYERVDSPVRKSDWLVYEHEGERYGTSFYNITKPVADWIANNTEKDAVIASWWDYGHFIRGLTGREVVVATPSNWTIQKTTAYGELIGKYGEKASRGEMKQLSSMYAGTEEEALQAMRENDVTHYLITRWDIMKFPAIQKVYSHQTQQFKYLNSLRCRSGCPPGTEEKARFRSNNLEAVAEFDSSGLESAKVIAAGNRTMDVELCSESSGERCVFMAFGELVYAPSEVSDRFIVKALNGEVEELEKAYSSRIGNVYRFQG